MASSILFGGTLTVPATITMIDSRMATWERTSGSWALRIRLHHTPVAGRRRCSERDHLPAQADSDSCQPADEHRDRSRRKLALPGMEDRRAHHDKHQPCRGQGCQPGKHVDGRRHCETKGSSQFGPPDELAERRRHRRRGPAPRLPSLAHRTVGNREEQAVEEESYRKDDLEHPGHHVHVRLSMKDKIIDWFMKIVNY